MAFYFFSEKLKKSPQIVTCIILALFTCTLSAAQKERTLSLHGSAKYPDNFTHFDYVFPQAPKGGTVKMAGFGTFDSLNPYIEKGTSPAGIHLLYDTLMVHSMDEPFTLYPLLAASVERAEDNSSITFNLNPAAHFHDGHPVTADDVKYTFELLQEKGSPFYRAYYADVKSVDILNKQSIRFNFQNTHNHELPLILAEISVLPKHFWEKPENNFEAANLSFPLGSGPYRILSAEAGKQIIYERVKNYWAADLPVNKGRYNFDSRRYDYYRDQSVAIEALKAGEYDIRFENVAKNWAQAYDTQAVTSGKLKKESIRTKSPAGMQGYAFNTRKPLFADRRVRKAIGYAMDFEWLNRNLFYNSYYRTKSYFANSDMGSTGLPSKEELALLEPLRAQLPPELFSKAYELPVSDASGNIRHQLSKALILLNDAGWSIKNGVLTNSNQEPFQFELLVVDPSTERVALPFKKNLEQMGIEMNIRTVDISQYINRLRTFDFDMLVSRIPQSNSPGNEQREFWSSEAADIPGSRNIMGIKSEAIDTLIEKVIKAPSREKLITAVKTLDRVLLWGEYIIPQWYLPDIRVIYSNKLHHPVSEPLYSFDFETWWISSENNAVSAKTEDKPSNESSSTSLFVISTIAIALFLLFWIFRSRGKRSHSQL